MSHLFVNGPTHGLTSSCTRALDPNIKPTWTFSSDSTSCLCPVALPSGLWLCILDSSWASRPLLVGLRDFDRPCKLLTSLNVTKIAEPCSWLYSCLWGQVGFPPREFADYCTPSAHPSPVSIIFKCFKIFKKYLAFVPYVSLPFASAVFGNFLDLVTSL